MVSRRHLTADCVLANSQALPSASARWSGKGEWRRPARCDPAVSAFAVVRGNEDSGQLSRLGVKRPYLLSVATPEPRKNLDAVLRRFIDLKKGGKLANISWSLRAPPGGKTGSNQRLDAARAHSLVLAGYVPDELMPMLYAHRCLVFPSLYEGFGMPFLRREPAARAWSPLISRSSGRPGMSMSFTCSPLWKGSRREFSELSTAKTASSPWPHLEGGRARPGARLRSKRGKYLGEELKQH